MPENVRRKEYFLNWHKYLCLKIDDAIVKTDIKLGGPPMRKRKRSNGRVERGHTCRLNRVCSSW